MADKIKNLNKKEYFKIYYKNNKDRYCYKLSNLRKLARRVAKNG